MQRWIVSGLVTMALLFGGGVFAYKTYQWNRPAPVWVPLPVRADLEPARRDEVIKTLKEKLLAKEVLLQISQDLNLDQKWKLASDEEGAREIGRRLFVKAGEADAPTGKVPAILIGVTGKNKERVVSGEIAVRLMEEVRKILGIIKPA